MCETMNASIDCDQINDDCMHIFNGKVYKQANHMKT